MGTEFIKQRECLFLSCRSPIFEQVQRRSDGRAIEAAETRDVDVGMFSGHEKRKVGAYRCMPLYAQ